MIAVKRTTEPAVLSRNKAKWLHNIKEAVRALKAVSPAGKTQAEKKLKNALNKYAHPDIRTALETMFHGKCAYCESAISHSQYPHIEHFKPKNLYPEKAVEWMNLLFACSVCNGAEFKGVNFPINSAENALLINPCDDNPDNHLDFVFGKSTGFAIVQAKDQKGKVSIKTYGLNRRRNGADLLYHRSTKIKKFIVLATYYKSDKRAQKLLDEACEDKSEYAAFANMVKARYT